MLRYTNSIAIWIFFVLLPLFAVKAQNKIPMNVPSNAIYLPDDTAATYAMMYPVRQKVTNITFSGAITTLNQDPPSLLPLAPNALNPAEVLLSEDPEPTPCCSSCVKNAYLVFHFHVGADKRTYEMYDTWTSGNCTATVTLGWDNNASTQVFNFTLDRNTPEQVIKKDISELHYNNCTNSSTNDKFTITINSISLPSAISDETRLDVTLVEEFSIVVGNCNSQKAQVIGTLIDNTLSSFASCSSGNAVPIVSGNPVKFRWYYPNCNDNFPNYQFQLLRLYNVNPALATTPQTINAFVDWRQALTLETGTEKQELTLTIPEGTGYYIWRVRPIGNSEPGGITNPANWGEWSFSSSQSVGTAVTFANCFSGNTTLADWEQGVFYYDPQFDSDKNWTYNRAFAEGDANGPRIFEGITYSDALLRPVQSQAVSKADQILHIQQSVYDFSGRPSISFMGIPTEREGNLRLEYQPQFMPVTATTTPYSALHFDGVSNAPPVNSVTLATSDFSNSYFTNANPDLGVPNAAGYPFAQTTFYPDGRVKEQGSIGFYHQLSQGNGVKLYYSSVADNELVSIFGSEAPAWNTVSKTIALDPSGRASVEYSGKDGKIIATCFVDNTELTNATQIDGEGYERITSESSSEKSYRNLSDEKVNVLSLEDVLTGGAIENGNTLRAVMEKAFVKSTVCTLDYRITPRIFKTAGCPDFCTYCKWKVTINIWEKENNTTPIYTNTFSDVPTSEEELPCSSATPQSLNKLVNYTITLPPGAYIFERIIEPADYSATQAVVLSYLSSIPPLDEIYSTVFGGGAYSTAKGQLDYYHNVFRPTNYDSYELISSVCPKIYLPEAKCEDKCDPTPSMDFEAYLFKKFQSMDPSSPHYTYNPQNYFKAWNTNNYKWPLTFGAGTFNAIVANMLAEGGDCQYSCDDLWEAWRVAVAEYKERGNITLEGIHFDLVERFLDNAGRRLCGLPPTPNDLVYKPYKYVDITTTDNCYTSLINLPPAIDDCCSPDTWQKWEIIRQCVRGKKTKLSKNPESPEKDPCPIPSCADPVLCKSEWDAYIACLQSYMNTLPVNCKNRCEERRGEFYNAIVREYGKLVPPLYLPGTKRADVNHTTIQMGDIDAIPMDKLQCKVNLLVEDCSKYCDLGIQISTTNVTKNVNADFVEYAKRMYGDFDIQLIPETNPPVPCTEGFTRLESLNHYKMQDIADYLTQKYTALSTTIKKPQAGNFGDLFLEYLDKVLGINGNNVPECFRKNNPPPHGAAYNDLQQIIVYPQTEGIFYSNAATYWNNTEYHPCPSDCILTFKGTRITQAEHPWVTELNDYMNDMWGMELDNPGVLGTHPSSTSYRNINPPEKYYHADVHNTGDTAFPYYYNAAYRTSIFMDRMRFDSVNNRTDGSVAFIPDFYYNPYDSTLSTLGIVSGRFQYIFNMFNPADTIFHDKWRGYAASILMPQPPTTPYGAYTTLYDQVFHLSFEPFHVINDTMLESIQLYRRYPGSGPTLAYSEIPTTEDMDEFYNIAASPNIYYAVDSSRMFSSIIGEFQQNEFGYLVFHDNKSGHDAEYSSVRFTVPYTVRIGEQCNPFPQDLCVPSSCNICVKWKPLGETNFPENPPTIEYEIRPCVDRQIDEIKRVIAAQYNEIVKNMREYVEPLYKKTCTNKNIDDKLTIKYTEKYYHYTLYYYDRAGSLVKTVPPQGVDIPKVSVTRNRSSIPTHTFVSTYRYNALGQPTEVSTPDAGTSWSVYNSIGQPMLSMNAAQQSSTSQQLYSYSQYDALGRIIESGQAQVPISTPVTTLNDFENSGLIGIAPGPGNRNEITVIDYSSLWTTSSLPAPYNGSSEPLPQNTRNRVGLAIYDEDGDLSTTTDKVNNIYSYDIHGNLAWSIEDLPGIGGSKMSYDYELISGNVLETRFREGFADEFRHRFEYDADNRLSGVFTSRTGGTIWEKDAAYEYYKDGSVARSTLGEDSVQGIDYTYTLEGTLKAINHPSLNISNDPGDDGSGGINGAQPTVPAKDAFGLSLNYYPGDFLRRFAVAGSPAVQSPFNSLSIPSVYSTGPETFVNTVNPTYDGMINGVSSNIYPSGASGQILEKHTADRYRYDWLGRLREDDFAALSDNDNDQDANPWTGDNYNNALSTYYKYDANGNLKKLSRYQADASSPYRKQIDSLSYTYENMPVTGDPTNRLNNISDNVGAAVSLVDIDNQGSNNYEYDASGRLITDQEQNLAAAPVIWGHDGKIRQATKGSTTVNYLYDPLGQLVRKTVTNGTNTGITWYTHDGSGTVTGIYERPVGYPVPLLREQPIYGLGRIGTIYPQGVLRTGSSADFTGIQTRRVGERGYELTDQTGNVRAVVSDIKAGTRSAGFTPILRSYANYYPFGMPQSGRTYTAPSTSSYRYGYNGVENDNALATDAGTTLFTEFRLNDTRTGGRWWSPDPIVNPSVSPYAGYGDNPISYMDPMGLAETENKPYGYKTGEVVVTAERMKPTPDNISRNYTPQYSTVPYGKVFRFDSYFRAILPSPDGKSDELWTYMNDQWTYASIPTEGEAALQRLQLTEKTLDAMYIGMGVVAAAPVVAAAVLPELAGTTAGTFLANGAKSAAIDGLGQFIAVKGDINQINFTSMGTAFVFGGFGVPNNWKTLLLKNTINESFEFTLENKLRTFSGDTDKDLKLLGRIAIGTVTDIGLNKVQNLNSKVTTQKLTNQKSLSSAKRNPNRVRTKAAANFVKQYNRNEVIKKAAKHPIGEIGFGGFQTLITNF